MSEPKEFLIRVEPNAVRSRTIIWVGLTAILIIMISALWVIADLPQRGTIRTGLQGPAPRDLNMIFQTLIIADQGTERLNEDKRKLLSRYAWVDKDKGVVRIPIGRAMEIVAGGSQ